MNRNCPHCQAPIHPEQERCAICEQAIPAANNTVSKRVTVAGESEQTAVDSLVSDSSSDISVVPNYSRHKPRKVRIPETVLSLNKKLRNIPSGKKGSNGNRFKTDAQTRPTIEANQRFLAQYREAYELTESREHDKALMILTKMIKEGTPEQQAECYGLRGYIFLQKMELEKAISQCSQAIKLNASDPQAYSWRAAARGEQNQWRQAFEDLHLAVERSDDRKSEFQRLMQSYAKVASEYFRQQISQGESTAKLLFERGWMHYRLGNVSKAVRDFQAALKLNPEHAWASAALVHLVSETDDSSLKMPDEALLQLCHYGNQGDNDCQRIVLAVQAKAYDRQHRATDATQCIARLQKLAGDDAQLQYECAQLQYDLDDAIAAAETLSRLLEKHPHYHSAWLLRARCAFAMRNDALAVDDYSEFLLYHPDNAAALVLRAEAELRRGHHDLAMDDVDRALEIDQLFFDAWLLRGRIALVAGQLDEAMTSCDRAKALNNQAAEVYALLGSVFRQMGDYGRAAEEYSRSIDYAKSDFEKADYLYHRGIEWYELQEFTDSFEDFSKSLELRPDHAGTLVWRAAASSRNENLGAAIEDLQHAIAIRPSSADAYRQLGRSIAEKAIGYFTRRHQRGRDELELFRYRGQAHHFLSQYDEAIKDYSTALKINKKDTTTRNARGRALRQKGNFKASCEDYTKVISLDAKNHAAYYGRAKALLEEGSIDTAKMDIEQAIALSGTRSRYHALAAQIAVHANDNEAQLSSLNHAITYDATDPSLYLDRAILFESEGKLENAMRDLTRSLEIEPTQVSVLQRRAQLALKMNSPLQAIEDFGKVLSTNPLSIASWSGLAQALAANDQHQDGLIALTKAMHRFPKSQDLAQIVFARGKLFQQAGRPAPAVADYSSVIDLLKDHPKQQASAMVARGLACVQLDEFEAAQTDFAMLRQMGLGKSMEVVSAVKWLQDQSKPRPVYLQPPKKMVRPTRPPITSMLVPNWLPETSWEQPPPHDQWVVNLGPQKEYGPVRYDILLLWVREGRVDRQARVLRSDWNRWRRLEKVFTNLNSDSRSSFPEMREASHE